MFDHKKILVSTALIFVIGFLFHPFVTKAAEQTYDTTVTFLLLVQPRFSLPGGTYTTGTIVSIASDGEDFIQYTTDNSTPTCSHGERYVNPITLTLTQNLKAVACYQTTKASLVSSATFTIPCLKNCATTPPAAGFIGSAPILPIVARVPITMGPTAPATSNLPQVPAVKPGSVSPSEGAFQFKKSIQLGSNGIDVLYLERKLQRLGYFPKNITPTNHFGPVTYKAVQQFQKANRLSPLTGALGPKTRAALNAIKS